MAKINSAAFLTTAQSFIGKSKLCLVKDSSKKAKYCNILTMQTFEGGLESAIESCVVITFLKTTVHCVFSQNSNCCDSVITYIKDEECLTDYRNYFNDHYSPLKEPDSWFNKTDQIFISIFYDTEIESYVVSFMTVEIPKSADLNLMKNIFSYATVN